MPVPSPAPREPEVAVLRPGGDLDLSTAPALEAALEEPVEQRRHLVVDLSGVTHIDASGYRTLEACQRLLHERGRELVLAAPTPRIRRLIDLLHLDAVIPTCATVEEALGSLRDVSLAGGQPRGTLVPVTFRFPGASAPRARRVVVTGSFNGWDPRAHPLSQAASGDWTGTVLLPPGQAVYCFWVDGAAWLDPEDDGRTPNGWGSEYSVRYVRAPQASAALAAPAQTA
jgi:anti-anti-sigma factor